MTVKKKLTLNVAVILFATGAVVCTSLVAVRFIRGKILVLTEQSTPFQTSTMELQRAIQGAATDLVKVGMSASLTELTSFKRDAEASSSQVKAAQEQVKALTLDKDINVYRELSGEARNLFSVTEERLKAQEAALLAAGQLHEKSADMSVKPLELCGPKSEAQHTSYGHNMTLSKPSPNRLMIR
jgi:methyl-accepting chemotaxis protein